MSVRFAWAACRRRRPGRDHDLDADGRTPAVGVELRGGELEQQGQLVVLLEGDDVEVHVGAQVHGGGSADTPAS